MRMALGIGYNGQGYNGWQSQVSGNTIQDKLEAALSRFATQRVSTLCAGRTDTVSSTTSLADETPDTDYSEAIETAREAAAEAPRANVDEGADLGGQPGAPDDGGAPRA